MPGEKFISISKSMKTERFKYMYVYTYVYDDQKYLNNGRCL
jgi:hypothetical protein